MRQTFCRTETYTIISIHPVFYGRLSGHYFAVVTYRNCRFQKFGFSFVVVLALVFACRISKGVSSADLLWNANPDPSVVGYNLYYGGASRTYTNMVSVGNTTNATVGGLLEGKTYYFAVTAYDIDGNESDYSAEATYVVPGWLVMTPGATAIDPLRIRFPVAPAHWYELQVSTDLKSWTTVWQTVGLTNTWIEYDAPVAGIGSQFYRVVLH